MKMKKPLISAGLISIVVVMCLVQRGWTQPGRQELSNERPRAGNETPRTAEPGNNTRFPSLNNLDVAKPFAENTAEGEIGTLVDELRDADDAEKTAVTRKLEAAVTKQFDRDMEYRESELRKLEERLNKLRGQLDRRRKAKAEIIQLQIKVLINEAEGLGFGRESLPFGDLPGRSGLPTFPRTAADRLQ
jgi:hypothetical protein